MIGTGLVGMFGIATVVAGTMETVAIIQVGTAGCKITTVAGTDGIAIIIPSGAETETPIGPRRRTMVLAGANGVTITSHVGGAVMAGPFGQMFTKSQTVAISSAIASSVTVLMERTKELANLIIAISAGKSSTIMKMTRAALKKAHQSNRASSATVAPLINSS
uniref:Uncharacterized protein n=1 Tax=Setaria digitata TaxID=48799 RepID=A0A915PSN2_9BILA